MTTYETTYKNFLFTLAGLIVNSEHTAIVKVESNSYIIQLIPVEKATFVYAQNICVDSIEELINDMASNTSRYSAFRLIAVYDGNTFYDRGLYEFLHEEFKDAVERGTVCIKENVAKEIADKLNAYMRETFLMNYPDVDSLPAEVRTANVDYEHFLRTAKKLVLDGETPKFEVCLCTPSDTHVLTYTTVFAYRKAVAENTADKYIATLAKSVVDGKRVYGNFHIHNLSKLYTYYMTCKAYEEVKNSLPDTDRAFVKIRDSVKDFMEKAPAGSVKAFKVVMDGKDEYLARNFRTLVSEGKEHGIEGKDVILSFDAEYIATTKLYSSGEYDERAYSAILVPMIFKNWKGNYERHYIQKVPVLAIRRVSYGKTVIYERKD